jgi:hypothetical protein
MRRFVISIGLLTFLFILGQASCFAALQYQEMYTSPGGTHKVLLMVNSSIYDPILTSLNQYIADLEAEGYQVILTKYIGGTAQELKGYIKVIPGLEGAVFIGDLPAVIFEIASEGDHGYQAFPCDLYFMDLNGQWLDTNGNGRYDAVNDAVNPEIWLGRISASLTAGTKFDEVTRTKAYFQRNHNYRTGSLPITNKAYVFNAHDIGAGSDAINIEWLYAADWNGARRLYHTTVNTNVGSTPASGYLNSLNTGYDWLSLNCHSNIKYHALSYDVYGSRYADPYLVYAYPCIIDTLQKPLFFSLNTCYAGNYLTRSYVAGYYVFSGIGNGLAAFAHTKLGYGSLFGGICFNLKSDIRQSLGKAYKTYFPYYLAGQIISYFGDTLLGDPTLTFDPPIASINPVSFSGGAVYLSGSGKINYGSIRNYNWRSDKDGFLSDQASFSTSSLTKGSHNIYLKVLDDKGRWSSEVKTTVNFPTCVSVSPATGTFNTDTPHTFTTVYADGDGYADLKTANFLVNTNPTLPGGFCAHYHKDYNALHVFDDTASVGSCFPGSSGVISSPRGELDCSQTTVSGSGNSLTVKWKVSFKSTLVGPRNVYLSATDKNGLSSGTVQKGNIVVNVPVNVAPTIVSLSPSSGTFKTNTTYTFTTVHSDANGYSDLKSANFLVNTGPTTTSAFYAHYRRDQNLLFLYNNSTISAGYTPGSANVIETPYGKLDCAGTTVSGSGSNLTINWKVSFKSTVVGTKNAYLSSSDMNGLSSGTVQKGTITISN